MTDSHELMRQMKQSYGTRGIAMSGYGQEEDRRLSQEAGFDAHLIKPVNPAALLQLLAKRAPASGSPSSGCP